jgi:hypothetical protein
MWQVPQDIDAQQLVDDILGFLLDALTIALDEDVPPARTGSRLYSSRARAVAAVQSVSAQA